MKVSLLRRLFVVVLVAGIGVVLYARKPRPLAGTVERRLVVAGVERTYLLHAGGAPRPGRPLVLVLHGMGGGGAEIERRTKGMFDKLADRDGAVIAYPYALGDPHRWSDGWVGPPAAAAPLPDDVAFLSALVDSLGAELGVDRQRVFAAGFSNGAAMAYRLACERPDLVAAVAPVAGGIPSDVARVCTTGAPVSIIAMHGTDDPIVPLVHPSRDPNVMWTKRDGCPEQPITWRLPDTDPTDGTETRVERFGPCAAGTDVVFYIIEGGGHAWPGGEARLGFRRRGAVPRDFDAATVIWTFFQEHPRQRNP